MEGINSARRSRWIDSAKGIGILLVVFGHVSRGVFNANIPFDTEVFNVIDSIIYSFHMPLFFFLSGLFLVKSFERYGAKQLIFNKIDTIFYPFILWSLLQGSIEVGLSQFTTGTTTFSEVFALLWKPRAQFWFLYALFFIFCFSTLVYFLFDKLKTFRKELFFLVSLLIFFNRDLLPGWPVFTFLSSFSIYFAAGTLFLPIVSNSIFQNASVFWGLGIVAVGLQYYFHFYLNLTFTDKGLLLLLTASASILWLITICHQLDKLKVTFFAYLGVFSMGIYLMHILAGSGIRIILQKVFDIYTLLPHLLIGTVFAVLLPLLAILIFNKLNVRFLFSAPISRYLATSQTPKIVQ